MAFNFLFRELVYILHKIKILVSEMKAKLNQIFQQCLEKKMEPIDAVNAIDSLIGGITAVQFKTGKKFTIQNHLAIYSLRYDGAVRKKQEKTVFLLAYGAYLKAQGNGSLAPGEVHISEKASTKHHRAGLVAYM